MVEASELATEAGARRSTLAQAHPPLRKKSSLVTLRRSVSSPWCLVSIPSRNIQYRVARIVPSRNCLKTKMLNCSVFFFFVTPLLRAVRKTLPTGSYRVASRGREAKARGLVPNWLSKHQELSRAPRTDQDYPYPLGAAATLVLQER